MSLSQLVDMQCFQQYSIYSKHFSPSLFSYICPLGSGTLLWLLLSSFFLSYIELFSVYNSRKWKRDAETLCGRHSDCSCLHCSHVFYLVHDMHDRLHAGLEIAKLWPQDGWQGRGVDEWAGLCRWVDHDCWASGMWRWQTGARRRALPSPRAAGENRNTQNQTNPNSLMSFGVAQGHLQCIKANSQGIIDPAVDNT